MQSSLVPYEREVMYRKRYKAERYGHRLSANFWMVVLNYMYMGGKELFITIISW